MFVNILWPTCGLDSRYFRKCLRSPGAAEPELREQQCTPFCAGLCAEQSWGVNLGTKFQGPSKSILGLIRPAGQHVQAGSCCSGIQHGGTSSNKITAKSLNWRMHLLLLFETLSDLSSSVPLVQTWVVVAASGCTASVPCMDRLSLMMGK